MKAAVSRNLVEAHNAILKSRALFGLHAANSYHILDFFTISEHALRSDIVAHALRLFDRSTKSASFWYIIRCVPSLIEVSIVEHCISLERLNDLANRFKIVRDQTQFHIDKNAVVDPGKVWSTAAISGKDLEWSLVSVYNIMADVQFAIVGQRPVLPECDGKDASLIVRAYKAQYPNAKIVV